MRFKRTDLLYRLRYTSRVSFLFVFFRDGRGGEGAGRGGDERGWGGRREGGPNFQIFKFINFQISKILKLKKLKLSVRV